MQHQHTHIGTYASCILPGLIQPLQVVPFHGDAPVLRRLMAGSAIHPEAGLHVAVHEMRDVLPADRTYCELHSHTCAELNLLLTFDQLVVRLTFDDEVYFQTAPASVFIPPGVRHSANVVEGNGFFIAILPRRDYATTFAEELTREAQP